MLLVADKELTLLELFKSHIQIEDGMDESMLSSYLESGKRYVSRTTGSKDSYLIIMAATIFYEYRVAEEELSKALKSFEIMLTLEGLSSEKKESESS